MSTEPASVIAEVFLHGKADTSPLLFISADLVFFGHFIKRRKKLGLRNGPGRIVAIGRI